MQRSQIQAKKKKVNEENVLKVKGNIIDQFIRYREISKFWEHEPAYCALGRDRISAYVGRMSKYPKSRSSP